METLNIKPATPIQVSREELSQIYTPLGSHTWRPIPHADVLSAVEDRLTQTGVSVVHDNLKVSHQGSRFFGVLNVQNGNAPEGCMLAVGIRNAHDQCFAAGLVAGMSVLVCSNLSFAGDGDIGFRRKHTVNIRNDFPDLVRGGVECLHRFWERQVRQVEAYRNTRLSELRARNLIIEALDNKVISASRIPDVLSEWRQPSHDEFSSEKNVWRFFNSITEALKKSNPFSLPAKTRELHKVCDNFVGLT